MSTQVQSIDWLETMKRSRSEFPYPPLPGTDGATLQQKEEKSFMSEVEKNALVGGLVIAKSQAQKDFAALDMKIKDVGRKLETLGGKLTTLQVTGDAKDLLNFLEQSGVGVESIRRLIEERGRLSSEIGQMNEQLAKLGIV